MWISVGFLTGSIVTVFYFQTLEFYVVTVSILIVSLYFKPFLNVLLGFICAICCIVLHFFVFYSFDLSEQDDQYAYEVKLVVEEVISNNAPQYIKAKIIKLEKQQFANFRAPKVMISLNSSQAISPGATFEATVNLKPFRSIKNFMVFDTQLNAFTQRVLFRGKVLNKEVVITPPTKNVIRHHYRRYVAQLFANTHLDWLYYVLLTGDKSLMDFEQKRAMQTLGLSHLLAISGLHISLVFGFCYFVIREFFKYSQLSMCQSVNISSLYSLIGFIAAFIYVYLSDFIVSATRALIMLGCFLLVYYLAKQALRWRNILFALVIVLVINPFNLLNPGLYFSFMAVAVIFIVLKSFPVKKVSMLSSIKMLMCIQLALFVGLLPLSLYFFKGVSLVGIVLNLFAIPLLSFVVMPALLFITLLGNVIDLAVLITFFDKLLWFLYELLLIIPQNWRWLNVGQVSLTMSLCIYLAFLLLYFIELRWLASIPLCVLLLEYYFTEKSLWQLSVFDVGHGTMVLIEKDKNVLIYDFGPLYFNKFSRINTVLLPYIAANKFYVRGAILSHLDNDHAGGVGHFNQAGFSDSFTRFHPQGSNEKCKSQSVDFYGLKVKVLTGGTFNNRNDNSCVVKVSGDGFSVLLPGDISKARESQLIERDYNLHSTILLSPHHGSHTSSSEAFINAVNPQIVIHSSAYKGQWQFPSDAVVARYNAIDALQFITGQHGQVRVKFYADGVQVETAREHESYWFIKD